MNGELPGFDVFQMFSQSGLNWTSNSRIKPFAHFNTTKFVSVSIEESFENWQVETEELPPCEFCMRIFDFDDGENSSHRIDEDSVGLAPSNLSPIV